MTDYIEQMRSGDRRQDQATAERVDLALQTLRAFDLHRARRFLSIAGVPEALAHSVLDRTPGRIRRDRLLSNTAYDRRRP